MKTLWMSRDCTLACSPKCHSAIALVYNHRKSPHSRSFLLCLALAAVQTHFLLDIPASQRPLQISSVFIPHVPDEDTEARRTKAVCKGSRRKHRGKAMKSGCASDSVLGEGKPGSS